MNEVKIDTEHYVVTVNSRVNDVHILCKETKMEYDMDPTRIYSLPHDIDEVHYTNETMEYIHIHFDEGFYQLKLESSNEIVLDHYSNKGDLIEEVGAWDFWDA